MLVIPNPMITLLCSGDFTIAPNTCITFCLSEKNKKQFPKLKSASREKNNEEMI